MTYSIEFNEALDYNLQLALYPQRPRKKVRLVDLLRKALQESFGDCLRIFGHMAAEQEEMKQIYKKDQTLAKRAERFIAEEYRQEYREIMHIRLRRLRSCNVMLGY